MRKLSDKAVLVCIETSDLLNGIISFKIKGFSARDLVTPHSACSAIKIAAVHDSKLNDFSLASSVMLGSKIYIIGGRDKKHPSKIKWFPNKRVLTIDTSTVSGGGAPAPSWDDVPPMKYGKSDPLLIEFDDKIYAIPGPKTTCYDKSVGKVEIYDPATNKWCVDSGIPNVQETICYNSGSHTPISNLYYNSAVVHDKMIHVSSWVNSSSLYFHTKEKVWKSSRLFGSYPFLSSRPPGSSEIKLSHDGGDPFEFIGLGLSLFDGQVLIGFSKWGHVAFLVKDGKVVGRQFLDAMTEMDAYRQYQCPTFPQKVCDRPSYLDLEDGYFCCAWSEYGDNRDEDDDDFWFACGYCDHCCGCVKKQFLVKVRAYRVRLKSSRKRTREGELQKHFLDVKIVNSLTIPYTVPNSLHTIRVIGCHLGAIPNI